MTREEITALFAKRLDAFARRDFASLASTYAEDCIVESPIAGRTVRGRAEVTHVNEMVVAAFPDVILKQEGLLIDGERVAQIVTMIGTDAGGFMGLAPTGKPFRVPMVFVCTLKEGQIVHERRIYDFTGLLVQIGVVKAKPV